MFLIWMSDLPRHTPNTKGKTVRIVSPHSSTSDSDENGDERAKNYFESQSRYRKGPHSPVPLSSAFRSTKKASPTDPFDAGSGLDESSDEDEPPSQPEYTLSDVSQKEKWIPSLSSTASWNAPLSFNNAESRRNDVGDGFRNPTSPENDAQSVTSKGQRMATGMASNPFVKTPVPGSTGEHIPTSAKQEAPTRSSNTSATTSGKMHLDVDAFKRLLLTGDKDSDTKGTPAIPPTHTTPLQFTHGDSSSNTDASSLSRQSILDSQTDLRLETPRTSHELSASDEEQRSKTSARSPKSGRFLPPVPRSRGGKILKSSSPQMTTFAESTSAKGQDCYGTQSTLPSPKSSTDLNKPLPPPPTTDSPETSIRSSPEPSATPAPRPRIPPTPPMSRRHSQLRSKYSSSSPRASMSIAEELSVESHNQDSTPGSTTKAPAPPPPPPRRRGRDRSQSSSENPSLTDLSAPTKSQTQKPSPPISHNPSISSTRLQTRASPSTSIGSTTAPPPPPRRRASSGSSFGSRRVSSDVSNLDGGSSVTAQSAQSSDARIPPVTEAKDIMADLSALQRDVDALRGKYDKSTSEQRR